VSAGPQGPPRALFDARGCLTTAAFDLLAGSHVGRAPDEIAAHLAACRGCQGRALARDPQGARRAAALPSTKTRVWRAAAVALLGLLVLLAAFAALRHVAGA
jgi:hypothetical protein